MFVQTGLSDKYRVLLVNPLLGNKIEEFKNFIKKQGLESTEIKPFDLLTKFSNYLGTEVVYRGLAADDLDELETSLKKEGCVSIVFKKNKDLALKGIKYFLTLDAPVDTYLGMICSKIKGDQTSPVLSTSSLQNVAASVAKTCMDKEPLVIKATVPKLSLIKQEGALDCFQRNSRGKYLCVDGRKYYYDDMASQIESFMFFTLPTKDAEIIRDINVGKFEWKDKY